MTISEFQPVRGSILALAAVASLTMIGAAPVLAAPDRNICEDTAVPTLDVASSAFSKTAAANPGDSAAMPGPAFELATRESAVESENEPPQTEHTAEEDAEIEETAIPADAGPLVYKRRMYRRDI